MSWRTIRLLGMLILFAAGAAVVVRLVPRLMLGQTAVLTLAVIAGVALLIGMQMLASAQADAEKRKRTARQRAHAALDVIAQTLDDDERAYLISRLEERDVIIDPPPELPPPGRKKRGVVRTPRR